MNTDLPFNNEAINRATSRRFESTLFAKPSSRVEYRNCQSCGAEFEAVIFPRKDLPDIDVHKCCHSCEFEQKQAEAAEQLAMELQKTQDANRDRWRGLCGVTGRHTRSSFANFESNLQPAAFKALSDFDGQSKVLYSPELWGMGKTHLVSALVNRLVETTEAAFISPNTGQILTKPCPAMFVVETTLMARILATFNDDAKESQDDVYNLFNSFKLLIIDDVGKVMPRDYNFLRQVYFKIIDRRYVEERHLILTTNLSLPGLEKHLGGACVDRMMEMCGSRGFIELKGSSYRQQKGFADRVKGESC